MPSIRQIDITNSPTVELWPAKRRLYIPQPDGCTVVSLPSGAIVHGGRHRKVGTLSFGGPRTTLVITGPGPRIATLATAIVEADRPSSGVVEV